MGHLIHYFEGYYWISNCTTKYIQFSDRCETLAFKLNIVGYANKKNEPMTLSQHS